MNESVGEGACPGPGGEAGTSAFRSSRVSDRHVALLRSGAGPGCNRSVIRASRGVVVRWKDDDPGRRDAPYGGLASHGYRPVAHLAEGDQPPLTCPDPRAPTPVPASGRP